MRYNQEAYFKKYGSSVLCSYAPKSDASIIAIVIFIFRKNLYNWINEGGEK